MAYVDLEKFHAFLKSKIKRPRCHFCRRGPLHHGSDLFIIEQWDFLPGIEKKPVIGVIPLQCDNCGAVVFINPKKSGLEIKPDDDDYDNEIKYL